MRLFPVGTRMERDIDGSDCQRSRLVARRFGECILQRFYVGEDYFLAQRCVVPSLDLRRESEYDYPLRAIRLESYLDSPLLRHACRDPFVSSDPLIDRREPGLEFSLELLARKLGIIEIHRLYRQLLTLG